MNKNLVGFFVLLFLVGLGCTSLSPNSEKLTHGKPDNSRNLVSDYDYDNYD